jgi:hypothetical protein
MPGAAPRLSGVESGYASSERISISNIPAVDPSDRKYYMRGHSLAIRLFRYVQDQRDQTKAPWFPEYGILHRLNIADINNQLASCKKEIYEVGEASNSQMEKLRRLLNDQGMKVTQWTGETCRPDTRANSYCNSKLSVYSIPRMASQERRGGTTKGSFGLLWGNRPDR